MGIVDKVLDLCTWTTDRHMYGEDSRSCIRICMPIGGFRGVFMIDIER